jgi:outer membrane protein W
MAATLVVALALAAAPATADAADGAWQLRVRGVWVDPDFSWGEIDDDGTEFDVTADSDFGYGLGLEYRFTDRLGVELAALRAKPDMDLTIAAPWGEDFEFSDGLSYRPITLGLNIHLTPDAPVDVYLSPLIALVDYGDLTYYVEDDVESFTVSSDFTWGATIGADVPLGDDGWSMNATVSYIDTDLEAENVSEPGRETFSFDTLIASLGIGFRF